MGNTFPCDLQHQILKPKLPQKTRAAEKHKWKGADGGKAALSTLTDKAEGHVSHELEQPVQLIQLSTCLRQQA